MPEHGFVSVGGDKCGFIQKGNYVRIPGEKTMPEDLNEPKLIVEKPIDWSRMTTAKDFLSEMETVAAERAVENQRAIDVGTAFFHEASKVGEGGGKGETIQVWPEDSPMPEMIIDTRRLSSRFAQLSPYKLARLSSTGGRLITSLLSEDYLSREGPEGFQADAVRDALGRGQGRIRNLPVATLEMVLARMENSLALILGFSLEALRKALGSKDRAEQGILLGIFKDGILSSRTAHLALDKVRAILREVPSQKAQTVAKDLVAAFNALGKFGGGGLRGRVTKKEGFDRYIALHADEFVDFAQSLKV